MKDAMMIIAFLDILFLDMIFSSGYKDKKG